MQIGSMVLENVARNLVRITVDGYSVIFSGNMAVAMTFPDGRKIKVGDRVRKMVTRHLNKFYHDYEALTFEAFTKEFNEAGTEKSIVFIPEKQPDDTQEQMTKPF